MIELQSYSNSGHGTSIVTTGGTSEVYRAHPKSFLTDFSHNYC